MMQIIFHNPKMKGQEPHPLPLSSKLERERGCSPLHLWWRGSRGEVKKKVPENPEPDGCFNRKMN